MLEMRNGIDKLIFFYILISLSIWYFKPNIMFDGDKIRQFGLGTNKTVFNFYIVNIFIAIILFYIFEIITLKKNNFL